MAVADNKLRLMPSPDDLTYALFEELAYKQARLLTNPIEPTLKGQILRCSPFIHVQFKT